MNIFLQNLLVAALLLLGFAGQAQSTMSLKQEVYSAWLVNEMEESGALRRGEVNSVVVIPSDRSSVRYVQKDFLSSAREALDAAYARLQSHNWQQSGKPTLGGSPLTIAQDSGAIRRYRYANQFCQWFDADKGREQMAMQLHAVIQLPNQLPASLNVDGLKVSIEDTSFFSSPKWRGWDSFYRRNKKSYGVVEFSDVSFSADGQAAAFYVGLHQAPLSATGGLVFMERTPTGWKTKYWRMLWIS